MILSEHKDLKYAITALPLKEKDKLLLRLIAKDKILTEHLHFKLLEDEADLRSRRSALLDEIAEQIKDNIANAKDAMLVFRTLNAKVSHHFKVTKDVLTELELRIQLLKQIPVDNKGGHYSAYSKYEERMVIYFVRASLSAYKKYIKLHEDLQFDLQADFNTVLKKAYAPKLAYTAEGLGLPEQV